VKYEYTVQGTDNTKGSPTDSGTIKVGT
jgi:hypothetical protein